MLVVSGCSAIIRKHDRLQPNLRLIRKYECTKTESPPKIDGQLNDPSWEQALWTESFVNIEGIQKTLPPYRTRVKILWDNQYLYIGAELTEPHVWATLTNHDSIVYHDNDFEVFIDPEGDERDYVEIEINAFNTVFDLLLKKTYRKGGPAIHEWNVKNLRTAVYINGTLNDPLDIDHGWSVELAIPWQTFNLSRQSPAPPESNDIWRMNFSRVQWKHVVRSGRYQKIPDMPEENSVWSPQGEMNMHIPDRWGYVLFVEDSP